MVDDIHLSKALAMWFDGISRLELSPSKSIDVCIDRVDFLMEHNPSAVKKSDKEKEYVEYWKKVVSYLLILKEKLG